MWADGTVLLPNAPLRRAGLEYRDVSLPLFGEHDLCVGADLGLGLDQPLGGLVHPSAAQYVAVAERAAAMASEGPCGVPDVPGEAEHKANLAERGLGGGFDACDLLSNLKLIDQRD